MWAGLSVGGWLSGDLVGSALLVLVARGNVLASAVRSPLTLTVHRLSATALGAVLLSVGVSASVSTVLRNLTDHEEAAPLVLVVILVIEASSVGSPGANAVHRLGATRLSALLVVVAVWASVSVVSGALGVLVVPAPVVLVV